MKLWNQVGRGQSVASFRFIHSRRALPLHLSHPVHSRLPRSRFPSPRIGRTKPPAILTPAVPLLPFFFINYRSRKVGAKDSYCCFGLTFQLAGPAIAAPSSLHPCPFTQSGGLLLLSGSNGILSVAIETIGKQRLKINYPVSSSSLMNK